MNNNIDLKKTEKMNYISFWCQKVIPLVFDDSLSYYESVCKFMQKLNEVISALNNNAECIDELQDKYIILQKNFDALENKWKEFKTYIENEFDSFKNEINIKQTEFETKINKDITDFETKINKDITDFETYVNNYLDNINVQEYVNVKIDELAEQGYFKDILESLGFNPDNYLSKNNEVEYIPTGDYNPATKKYVDEHSSQGVVYNAGDGITIENNTISSNNSNIKNYTKGVKVTNENYGFIFGHNNNAENYKQQVIGNYNKINRDNDSIVIGSNNNYLESKINDNNIIIGNNNKVSLTIKEINESIIIGNNITNTRIDTDYKIFIGYNSNQIKINEDTININDGIIIRDNIEFNKPIFDINIENDINTNNAVNSNIINYLGDEDLVLSNLIDNIDYNNKTLPIKWINNDSKIKTLFKNAGYLNSLEEKYNKQLIYGINYENNVTGDTQIILRNGFYFLNMSVTYPSSITGNDSTLTLFKINITSSDTKINGFKNFNAIIVNKNDTSSKERTAPIRVVKTSDTEYSVVYVGNETEEKPYNYTIEFGGVIGYL